MNSTEALQAALKNEREIFLNTLSSFVLLDIGTVESIQDGKARVVSSTFIGNRPVVYEEAEVIYPGNTAGGYISECTGSACLIFLPRSCMPDTLSQVLHFEAPPYSIQGAKALPICNGTNSVVRAYFGGNGTYSILGQLYSIQFTENDISFQRQDGTSEVSIDGAGQLHVLRQVDNNRYKKDIEDSQVVTTWLSKGQTGSVLWTDTLSADGSRSFVQSNPDDEQSDPLFSITIDKEGKATITMSQGMTFETKDALVLKGKSVSIQSTDGDVAVTSSGDTTVSTGTGHKFAVNGDNLEVSKT